MALKGNQKKLDKNNNNKIDAQDFKILKAEKAKGRGMGLQDEKVKPGKVMKARYGAEIKPKGPVILRPKPTGQGGKPLKPKPIKPNKKYTKGGGADTGRVGELKSKIAVATDKLKKHFQKRKRRPDYIKPPERKSMIPADVAETARTAESFTPTGMGRQIAKKITGKMGGGMMSKPMGYKSGTSVKVKCKLGRNKPTKMY